MLLGLAYGLCLVSGLRQAEQMARPGQRGAVVACYYALAYLGFATPYLAAGLGAVTSPAGAFGVLAVIAVMIAVWTRCGLLAGCGAGRQRLQGLVQGAGRRQLAVQPGQPEQLPDLRPGTDHVQAAAVPGGALGRAD